MTRVTQAERRIECDSIIVIIVSEGNSQVGRGKSHRVIPWVVFLVLYAVYESIKKGQQGAPIPSHEFPGLPRSHLDSLQSLGSSAPPLGSWTPREARGSKGRGQEE